MNLSNKIYWIDLNRFDIKPDKSTWVEMSKVLYKNGFEVNILTGYSKFHYTNKSRKFKIKYFESFNHGWFFRITLLFNIMLWLIKYGKKNDIYLLHPCSLFIAPVLLLLGRKNIHLDIRTVPVEIHTKKDRLDKFIYWTIPMTLLSKLAKSHSFITEPLRYLITNKYRLNNIPHIVWESGVDTQYFLPGNDSQPSSKKFSLLYHGTITKNRGIMRVIHAIKRLDKKYADIFQFIVIGDGSALAGIKEVVRNENLSHCVKIKGMLPYEDIAQEIRAVDCCICPLPNRAEWNISSPLKVFEYMATAKPMILTPIPAHKNILDNQKYVVWSEGSSISDFVHAIEYAFINRKELQISARTAPDFVKQHYDWNCQGDKLSLFFNAMFNPKKPLNINEINNPTYLEIPDNLNAVPCKLNSTLNKVNLKTNKINLKH